MKAIAITQAAADGNNIPSLTEIDLPIPTAHGRDLLVAVKAISVNPVDTKVRAGFQGDTPRVLGWDAVGVVQSVGEEVTLFAPGDGSGTPARWAGPAATVNISWWMSVWWRTNRAPSIMPPPPRCR